ncbi:hypothetical protein FHETE_8808 [Fusarium heterosporum]|uniref:Uncharacterized protein n=1 Tax=Fusarium heterosporum TaxID=42747 RepID=A0A8H5T0T1_FUSHE|nr:hypothetical protein FHETE_8808 [Fusarium heterosporum]
MENNDLAIHPALWGYVHGIPDRMPFQVIRVQSGGRSAKTASKKAPKTRGTKSKGGKSKAAAVEKPDSESNDIPGTPPGPPWTPAELQITGVPSKDLVVIVGLSLPREVVDDVAPSTSKKEFDPTRDLIIDTTPGAKYLVRPLTQKRSLLFLLLDKNDEGLSSMVANSADNEPCTVLFREFMDGVKSTQKNKRLDLARTAMTTFCKEYLRRECGDEVASTNTSGTALAENQGSVWKNHNHPAVRLYLDLQKLLVMLQTDGYLAQIDKQLATITAKF